MSSKSLKSLKSSKSYVVAIPSYKRQETLLTKSLKTLIDGGVPASKIYIFVANKEEHEEYKKHIPKEMYHELVIGVKGITNQRKFMLKYFPEGQEIVSIDDDVECLYKSKGTTKLVQVKNIDKFYKEAFERLHKEQLYIWGIYPVRNPFFMKDTVTTNLKFIIGTMYGFINRHNPKLQPSKKIKEKEDYEQSILYYMMDGGVLRYNNITIKTKFHAEGGLGKIEQRFEANKEAAEYLEKKYPQYVSVFHRENGMTEVRLRDSTNKTEKKETNKTRKSIKTRKNNKTEKIV
jgi:hypothetical protein